MGGLSIKVVIDSFALNIWWNLNMLRDTLKGSQQAAMGDYS
jgi:hypothetical protein